MMTTEDRLKELGIELPSPQSPAATTFRRCGRGISCTWRE